MKRVLTFVNVPFAFFVFALLASPARSQEAKPLSPQSLMSQLKWRCVGPYIGGRVVTVTGVPGNNNLFYAGAVGGGVWKSTDAGVQWENITDGKLPGPSSSIGAVAVAPSDPNTLYVGTGEADIRGDMIPGDGVFKSTDAGKTWQSVGLREAHSISAILVDPKNPNSSMSLPWGMSSRRIRTAEFSSPPMAARPGRRFCSWITTPGAICLVMDPNHPGDHVRLDVAGGAHALGTYQWRAGQRHL